MTQKRVALDGFRSRHSPERSARERPSLTRGWLHSPSWYTHSYTIIEMSRSIGARLPQRLSGQRRRHPMRLTQLLTRV